MTLLDLYMLIGIIWVLIVNCYLPNGIARNLFHFALWFISMPMVLGQAIRERHK